MIRPRVGFVVFGVHKDGVQDALGQPWVDELVIKNAKEALRTAGADLIVEDLIISTKQEARACFSRFKKMEDLDLVVLFSGTWIWAAHLVAVLRDFAFTGKGILLWTHPGSQGWRTVGGLELHGALNEVDIHHRSVYGASDDPSTIDRIMSYCRANHEKNQLSMSTAGAFGGRGLGQTTGVADPSQWMKVFGVDIDSRDTTQLIETAKQITQDELIKAKADIQQLFSNPLTEGDREERGIRLYLAIKKVIKKEGWDFYTIQGVPGIGDDYIGPNFVQSLMLEQRVGTSSLCDFNTLMTVKLMNDFSEEPVYYGDIQHVDRSNNEIKIITGSCPPSLAGKIGPAKFAERGLPSEGKAGGLTVDLVCKSGEGVLARLGRNNGEFEMIIVHCTVFEPSAEQIEARRKECGMPHWQHAFVTAHCDIDKLLEAWHSQYIVLGYRPHLYDDLLAFCELTGIRVIAL
jgi:hypothetical protein